MKQYRIIRVYARDADRLEELRRQLVRADGINRPIADALNRLLVMLDNESDPNTYDEDGNMIEPEPPKEA